MVRQDSFETLVYISQNEFSAQKLLGFAAHRIVSVYLVGGALVKLFNFMSALVIRQIIHNINANGEKSETTII